MKTPISVPRLVFSCPCCKLDTQIRQEFGDVYLLATPGSVIEPMDEERLLEIKELLLTARIREVCIIGSPDCSFVKTALKPILTPSLGYDTVIRKLRVPSDRGYTLSRKLVRHQALVLRETLRNSLPVDFGLLQVRGILTCGTSRRFLDIR